MKKRWWGIWGMAAVAGAALACPGNAAQAQEALPPPIGAAQALLKEQRLYKGPVDGVESPATAAAVRRYQILHGLTATGRLDPPTLAVMLKPAPLSPKLTESDREVLRELEATPPPPPVAEEKREPIPPAPPQPEVTPSPTPAKGKRVPAVKRNRHPGHSSRSGRSTREFYGPRGD